MNRDTLQADLEASLRKLEETLGRKIVFGFLQGSQNYDLDTEASDLDAKAFCLPSFDDLYSSNMVSKTFDYPLGQITVHDLRMLPQLWLKMNPTYIEGFFSCAKYKEENGLLGETIFNELFKAYRSEFLRSIYGTFLKKREEMHHPTAIREPVIAQYGYDIKSASHALRLGYLFEDILAFDENLSAYQQYSIALRPKGERHDLLMDVKMGRVREEELIEPFQRFQAEMFDYISTLPKEKIAIPQSILTLEEAIKDRIKREFNV